MMMAEPEPLQRLFAPRSLAVVGASTDPGKRGNQALRALRDAGYPHPVYGVNPGGGCAHGVQFVRSVDELPDGIDVALVALPARLVPDTVRALAARGVGGAVVLANGFAESGADGVALDAELRNAVASTGLRMLGPNTSGMLNVPLGVNLVGLPDVPAGPISVLTQSGNLLLSLVEDIRASAGPGIARFAGLGNQSDLAYPELLAHLAADEATGVVAIHSEGITSGREFLIAAAEATRDTPVVLLRGGRSDIGRRTALSHTASVAGPDGVTTAVLRQAGVELVDRSDELAVVAGVLATTPAMPDGTGVAVLSDGGGHAALAADALVQRGVPLAATGEDTRSRLRTVLGGLAAVDNPVDVAGATDADPSLFAEATDVLCADPAVGLVLVIGLYGGYHLRFDPALATVEDDTARRMCQISSRRSTPLVVQSCYAAARPANHDVLRTGGVSVLGSIDHAVRAVAALAARGRRLATRHDRSDLRLPGAQQVRSATQTKVLDEPAARTLVRAAGIDVGPWQLATSAEQLREALAGYAEPCAVKVVSPQVSHKSDAGGVALHVTADDAVHVWDSVRTAVVAAVPDAEIDGMVVTPMVPSGSELLVGAVRDENFGPVVAFGSGGVLVEAIADTSFRAAPFSRIEATELINETVASRLLDGYRGLPAVDRTALADFLVAVGDLITDRPEIVELDFNPVLGHGRDLRPVDVRVVIDDGQPSS